MSFRGSGEGVGERAASPIVSIEKCTTLAKLK